jgi:hypothetical protein
MSLSGLPLIETCVERLHGVDHSGEHLTRLLNATSNTVRVTSFQTGVSDIERMGEIIGDFAHAPTVASHRAELVEGPPDG